MTVEIIGVALVAIVPALLFIGWLAMMVTVVAALGVFPHLWRTPWGVAAPWTDRVARSHGLRVVGWTADTHDWRGDDAAALPVSVSDAADAGDDLADL